MNYKKKIWRKNIFLIAFYVKRFILRLRINKNNANKLKYFHYKLLKDFFCYKHENKNFHNFKELREEEYIKIIQGSHTKQLNLLSKKLHFCKN